MCEETRVRYFHHQYRADRDVGIKYEKLEGVEIVNKLSLCTTHTDTVVMESRKESTVISLRFLQVNHLRVNEGFFKEYEAITRLEIGCPISVTWLFQNIVSFVSLQHLRFGKQACFEYSNDGAVVELEADANHNVLVLEVEYDSKAYLSLSSKKQEQVDLNFIQVLQLSKIGFPELQECTIRVPKSVENHLDSFVNNFTRFREKGQKRCRAAEEHVYFICTNKSIASEMQPLVDPRIMKQKEEESRDKRTSANSDHEPSSSKEIMRPVAAIITVKREVERRKDVEFDDNVPASSVSNTQYRLKPPKMNPALFFTLIGIPILLIVSSFGTSSTAQSLRSSFGEPCNKTHRCDRRALLNCESETCVCIKPHEMMFQSKIGKCGTKIGEQCKYMIETTDGQIAYEIQACVEDAICDPEGFCACKEYFTETVNGTCTPSLNQQYNETCDAKLKCSADFGLECFKNRCYCNIASEFSLDSRHCSGLAGKPCILSTCTTNSECTEEDICQCNAGYFRVDARSTCEKQRERLLPCEYDEQCEHIRPSFQLTCVNKVCHCNPENSLYGAIQAFSADKKSGESLSQCLGKEGQPCIQGHCAEGVLCSYENDNITGLCVCQPGYTPTGSGKCAIGNGGKCESPEMCHPGLVCKDSVCSCRYSDKQSYSQIRGKCVTKVGGPCVDDSLCTDHAVCRSGKCQCLGLLGYVKSTEGSCEMEYASTMESFANA
ncbi:unnamed protein product [Allacma fusca]|uniref:EGF-like domain-containing protein n=1 Tax=Allacma fusca TaxID=39272 RepID=A0A8J2P776_9HEXA|nr:unnamed protein product [Allacma fusca]